MKAKRWQKLIDIEKEKIAAIAEELGWSIEEVTMSFIRRDAAERLIETWRKIYARTEITDRLRRKSKRRKS